MRKLITLNKTIEAKLIKAAQFEAGFCHFLVFSHFWPSCFTYVIDFSRFQFCDFQKVNWLFVLFLNNRTNYIICITLNNPYIFAVL